MCDKAGTISSQSYRRIPRILFLSILGLFCVLVTSSCAPDLVQVYPESSVEAGSSTVVGLDRIRKDNKIQVRLKNEEPFDAVFRERTTDTLRVNKMVWKKQIFGKKEPKSDEVTEIPIHALDRIKVYRTSTNQKIGSVVAAVVFVTAIASMTQ